MLSLLIAHYSFTRSTSDWNALYCIILNQMVNRLKNSVIALLLLSFTCLGATPVRIGMPQGETQLQHKLQNQLTAVYARLGFAPEFIALPSERRLRLLTNGEIDADLFRICQLDDTDSGVLVVPVELDSLRLNAYSLSTEKLHNWQQRADLLISHIRGFKMAEQQSFSGVRVLVNSDQQAFGLMLQGRVDIVLEDSYTAERYLTTEHSMQHIVWQSVADFAVCHVIHQSLQPYLEALVLQLKP